MHRDIDTALLRAFIAVVETGSVTGAAALLNLTQAAVSQQLKRLEELFGTQLFERDLHFFEPRQNLSRRQHGDIVFGEVHSRFEHGD